MIVNSLKKSPNGGAPVMAIAPASHNAPVIGKYSDTPRICPMRFVP
jgi:hypothetical protein